MEWLEMFSEGGTGLEGCPRPGTDKKETPGVWYL